MRLYDFYMIFRMFDIMAGRRGYRMQGRGLVHRPKPLTDKQIEKNFAKATRRPHASTRPRILYRPVNRTNGAIVGLAILLLLILFSLLTVIVNMPTH